MNKLPRGRLYVNSPLFRDNLGPNTFDPSEFPSLGGGSGGAGLAGRPNYGE